MASSADAVVSRRRWWIRLSLTVVTIGAVAALGISERDVVASSFGQIAHVRLGWVAAAIALEAVSVTTFGQMQQRLFRAGGSTPSLSRLLAIVPSATAISAWVPFIGPQLAAAFSYRRFKRLGIDSSLAGWVLVVAGVLSSLAGVLLISTGAILSGNNAVAITGAVGAGLGLLGLAIGAAVLRSPRWQARVTRVLEHVLRRVQRLAHRPEGHPDEQAKEAVRRLRTFHLSRSEWSLAAVFGLLNWLTEVGVLAVCILAVGVGVPWQGLLLVYGVQFAAGGITTITPGGIGVVELALTVALVGAGLHRPSALAAVLVFRLVSFWMVTLVGGLAFLAPHLGPGGPDRRIRFRSSADRLSSTHGPIQWR